MKVLKGAAKGHTDKFEISETKNNRIVVGLSWDPKQPEELEHPQKKQSEDILDKAVYYIQDVARSMSYIQFNRKLARHIDLAERDEDKDFFDLDLYCYIYDEEGNFVDKIGPEFEDAIDESVSTYHSGEDYDGSGGPDDEQIHIETKNMPDNYKHFVFVVLSDCKYSLDEINDPVIRLADSKTEENFLEVSINPASNLNAYAYIFAQIDNNNGEWEYKNISEYADFDLDFKSYFKNKLIP